MLRRRGLYAKGYRMKGWVIPPKNDIVSHFVECYWFIKTHKDDDGIDHPKLNPDTCGHLIITPKSQAYDYRSEATTTQGKGSHWLFPYNKTYTMDHSEPMTLLGVKFHAGALYGLNLAPTALQINDIAQVDVSDIFTPFSQNKICNIEGLLSAAEFQQTECTAQLDELLLPWLQTAKEDKHSALVKKALALPQAVAISNMGEQLHCSQRTLERSFLRVIGMTLKQCQSINKLDNLLTYLSKYQQDEIDWSDVALQFGFSDQPHLIRYLKNAIGNTPGEYAKQREFVIDIYGNFQ